MELIIAQKIKEDTNKKKSYFHFFSGKCCMPIPVFSSLNTFQSIFDNKLSGLFKLRKIFGFRASRNYVSNKTYRMVGWVLGRTNCNPIFNRPGVAGAVLQSPLLLIDSFIKAVRDPFPPSLQNIINPNHKC